MSNAAGRSFVRRRAALVALAAVPGALLAGCTANPAPDGFPPQPVRVIFFEDDSMAIGPVAMNVIQDAANVARRYPQAPVRVLGFIAPDPNDAPSTLQARLLSRRRADRVVTELVNLGVPQERIQVLGRGQGAVADIPLEARRVEIHIGSN